MIFSLLCPSHTPKLCLLPSRVHTSSQRKHYKKVQPNLISSDNPITPPFNLSSLSPQLDFPLHQCLFHPPKSSALRGSPTPRLLTSAGRSRTTAMATSAGRRKFSVRHPVVVDVGCSCRKTRSIASLFTTTVAPSTTRKPKLNPQTPAKHHHPLSSYYPFSPSTNTNFSTTSHNFSSSSITTSPEDLSSSPSWTTTTKKPSPPTVTKKNTNKATKTTKGRVANESVAVVKDSEDPYHDFKDSMLQMILEKEIYAWDDLRELLHRFLSLNSPCHHDSILRAFTEIWSEIFSPSSSSNVGDGGKRGGSGRKQHRHHYHHRM